MSDRPCRCPATTLVALIPLLLVSCSKGPDYPPDWPRPATEVRDASGRRCVDLSGHYVLPRAIQARVAKGKARILHPTSFLSASAGKEASGRAHSTIGLSSMVLDGPAEGRIKVAFYDRKQKLLSEHVLEEGTDYRCRGPWVTDTSRAPTRAKPPRFYTRDVEGRLIGHTAYSAVGMVPLLGVIPLPTYVEDRVWWRLEPSP